MNVAVLDENAPESLSALVFRDTVAPASFTGSIAPEVENLTFFQKQVAKPVKLPTAKSTARSIDHNFRMVLHDKDMYASDINTLFLSGPRHDLYAKLDTQALKKFSRYLIESTKNITFLVPDSYKFGVSNSASQDNLLIFNIIQSLSFGRNRSRDRAIAGRITTLYRVLREEGEPLDPRSLKQFTDFMLKHSNLPLPKITVAPEGTTRARWLNGPGDFVAIEFTGQSMVKLIAEIPRGDGQTATHFATEPLESVLDVSRAMGAKI